MKCKHKIICDALYHVKDELYTPVKYCLECKDVILRMPDKGEQEADEKC